MKSQTSVQMEFSTRRSLLFQVTCLFSLSSVIALAAVMAQSALMRANSLQTLEGEIRQAETTLLRKTVQVATERMTYYAYSADPGNSSIWQLRGRRSPVEAINSESKRKIEVVVGPVYERLLQQGTLSTLAILDLKGNELAVFDSDPFRTKALHVPSENEQPDQARAISFKNIELRPNLSSGYFDFQERLQKYILFPIYSNAKVLAYVYYGLDFERLKAAFEIESASEVWLLDNALKMGAGITKYVIENFQSSGGESATITSEKKTFAVSNYSVTTSSGATKEFVFLKDISTAYKAGKDFQLLMIASLVFLLMASTGIVFGLLRHRLRPLGSSIRVLRDLSEGDLESKVDYSRDDEIGKIGQAIDIFREKLVSFNSMNNEARRQRMQQQEEVLKQTSALIDLLPSERATSLDNEIEIIQSEIDNSLDQQSNTTLKVGDDSVTKLFAKSFSLLGQELSAQYQILDEKVKVRTAELEAKSNEIEVALKKNEELLLNILPRSIADRMKRHKISIAEHFSDASILFADLVGFTEISQTTGPGELVELLNGIFSKFDMLTDKYELEKIKTIGDGYMVAGGVPEPSDGHCERMAGLALSMQGYIDELSPFHGKKIQLRVGIHNGPIIAGVIGTRKFAYDLWGDTVNIAARMESHGLPGKIQISDSMADVLRNEFTLVSRGKIEVKGKGLMATHWLTDKSA